MLPAAFYEVDLTEEAVPWHWHDEWETVFVLQGCAAMSAGMKQITLRAGDGIFINSGVLHRFDPVKEEPGLLHTVMFHPRLVGGSMDSIFWQKYIYPLMNHPAADVMKISGEEQWGCSAIHMLKKAWESGMGEAAGYEFALRDALSEFTCNLYQHVPDHTPRIPDKDLRDHERMKQMLHYIQSRFCDEITLEDIAAAASVSKSECLRCFRNMIKTTPVRYLRQYRLHRAAELLTETDSSVAEIGSACGFRDMSYFAGEFRILTGMTPGEYRRKKKQSTAGVTHDFTAADRELTKTEMMEESHEYLCIKRQPFGRKQHHFADGSVPGKEISR